MKQEDKVKEIWESYGFDFERVKDLMIDYGGLNAVYLMAHHFELYKEIANKIGLKNFAGAETGTHMYLMRKNNSNETKA